jgi:hypothetical protein
MKRMGHWKMDISCVGCDSLLRVKATDIERLHGFGEIPCFVFKCIACGQTNSVDPRDLPSGVQATAFYAGYKKPPAENEAHA